MKKTPTKKKERTILYDTTRLVQGRRMKMYTVWNTLTNASNKSWVKNRSYTFSDEKWYKRISNADIWPF